MNPETYLKNVICDECGKETVVETIELPSPQKEPVKKMSEYTGFGGTIITNAVYIMRDHTLTCKSCGHTRKFSN